MPAHPTRDLNKEEKQAVREQLADGVPREIIAEELKISFGQIAAFRANAKIHGPALTKKEMVRRAYRYARARANARDEDIISEAEALALFDDQEGKCALTGRAFSDAKQNPAGKILAYPLRPSLDRIKNAKGYVRGNVRLVTQWANFARGEWTDEVFYKMCAAATEVAHEAGKLK